MSNYTFKSEETIMLPQVEQIAARVRELRTILDIEADDVAEKIGVSRETYDEYEDAYGETTADMSVSETETDGSYDA